MNVNNVASDVVRLACLDCQRSTSGRCVMHSGISFRYVYYNEKTVRCFCPGCDTPIESFWKYCPMCGEMV